MAAVILLGFAISASANESLKNDLAIVSARIYTAPDAEPIEDGEVVIRGGKIAKVGTRKKVKIPRGIQVINAEGNILTAVFWNSHVYLISPSQLGAAQMRSKNMALIPTVSLFEIEIKRSGGSADVVDQALKMITEEVRLYSEAGGQILFGTDVGYTDLFDTTREYQLISNVLSWRQILASLTTAPAENLNVIPTQI